MPIWRKPNQFNLMRITDTLKTRDTIIAFDDNFMIHFIRISDMYQYLIRNFLLETQINEEKIQITFDEWYEEKDLSHIDICSYLLSEKLKKKIHNTINNILNN